MPGLRLKIWLDDTPDDSPYGFTLLKKASKEECDKAWEHVRSILKNEPMRGALNLYDDHIYLHFPKIKLRTVLREDIA